MYDCDHSPPGIQVVSITSTPVAKTWPSGQENRTRDPNTVLIAVPMAPTRSKRMEFKELFLRFHEWMIDIVRIGILAYIHLMSSHWQNFLPFYKKLFGKYSPIEKHANLDAKGIQIAFNKASRFFWYHLRPNWSNIRGTGKE